MAISPPLCPFVTTALAANGGSNGILTVGDTSDLRPGARVWLRSNAVTAIELVIEAVLSTTQVAVRDPSKIGSMRFNSAAYLTADAATLTQNVQTDFESPGSW
jgi:hypothetical protein